MKKQCKYLLFSLCLFLAWSCEKEEIGIDQTDYQVSIIENTGIASFDDTTIKEYRGQLAKMLSIVAAKNPDIISVLQESTTENKRTKQYYEDEFFFNLDKGKKRSSLNNESYKEVLSNTFEDAQEILAYLEEHDPGLAVLLVDRPNKSVDQVKFYVNNNDFDDTDEKTIVSYYQNGELKQQTLGEGADNLSFVVRQSEAFYSNERLALNFNRGIKKSIENNEANYIKMSDKGYIYLNRGQSVDVAGDGADPRDPPTECERDLINGKEHFARFRARNDFDGFLNGTGEFMFFFSHYDDIPPLTNGQQLTATGGPDPLLVQNVQDNNQWIYPDYPIVTWDRTAIGDKILVAVVEQDISIDVQPVQIIQEIGFYNPFIDATITADVLFSFPLSQFDDAIGEQFVEYCDPTLNDILSENETYSLGEDVDFHQIEHLSDPISCRYQFFKENNGQGFLGQKNNCTPQSINLTQNNSISPNDEIRSMRILEAPAGKVIRVFDNSQGSTNDDYAIITVLNDISGSNAVTINSFENNYSTNFVNVQYCCGGNLDGKISRVEFN